MPVNTFDSYEAVGNAEDVLDVIYDISPTETPFMTMVPRTKATARVHSWQTDALSAAAHAVAVEGADATIAAIGATTLLSNNTQIMQKAFGISGTQEAVTKYGRKSEMAYQTAKKARELKRDMETSLLRNSAKVAGSETVGRELSGVPTWLKTNTSAGASGADPTTQGASARTDGTQRDFTEEMLKNVLQRMYTAGGDEANCLMVGGHNKQVVSGFAGNATRYIDNSEQKLVTSVDVYVGDFHTLQVKANRFMRARDALILQPDMWGIAYLRPFKVQDIGVKGDSREKQMIVEFTLESRNEAANGGVFDLTTS